MNANFAIRLTFRSIFTIVVVVVSILGIWSTVIANGSNTQSGSVSGVRYTAKVGTSTVSAGGWNGYVEATAASSITDVGWYWWTTREYCNGVIYWQKTHSGYTDSTYPYTFAHGDEPTFPYKVVCPSGQTHKISSYAKFDFEHRAEKKSPILNFVEPLPSGW